MSNIQSNLATPVAIVVPCANPTVEPEVHALLPSNFFPYVARLPFYDQLDLKQRLAQYVPDLTQTIKTLSGLKPAGVLVACTGSSYPLGISGDQAWTKKASAQLQAPVVSAAGAVAQVLTKLQPKEIYLISPYPSWLTQEVTQFWSDAGYVIKKVVELDKSGQIYDLTAADIAAAVHTALTEIAQQPDIVILIAGTGVPSLSAADAVAPTTTVPIITSQLAGIWSLLMTIGAAYDIQNSNSAALRKLDNQISLKVTQK